MYRVNANANVRWNNTFSKQFLLSNGVKQGAVLSAILFFVYLNDLYKIRRMRRSGCWVSGDFIGYVVILTIYFFWLHVLMLFKVCYQRARCMLKNIICNLTQT